MQLIGIAGAVFSGKDAIADILVENYGFVKYAFSDPLYEEVAAAFGVTVEFLQDRQFKEQQQGCLTVSTCNDEAFARIMRAHVPSYIGSFNAVYHPFSPRSILQLWGTEYRRAQDPDYWVKKADEFAGALDMADRHSLAQAVLENGGQGWSPRYAGIAVPSVRFPNEVEWIRAGGGAVWHVKRPLTTIDAVNASHVSAQVLPLQTGDKLIQNNGTLAQLRTGVSLALQGNDIINIAGV